MSQTCFYETLGVERSADEKSLKSAFRKKAMQYHPDRNPDDPEAEARFKEVSAAYEVLSDAEKRAAYDRFGHAAFEGGGPGAGGFGARGGRPEDVFADVFGDMFGDIFGARRGGGRSNIRRGDDLRYDYEISLEEAFSGKQAELDIPTTRTCEDCEGSGAAPGTAPETCPACGGTGRVRAQQGFFTMERTCTRCQGRGQIITKPCRTCSGRGRVRAERTLSVKIPAGIEDGQKIRLTGEGDPGANGGPAGDLYIFISIKEHDLFERDGPHLFARAPVPMCKAALGGEIEMPTIDGGKSRITIPEGSPTGKRMRLRGKGMPQLNTGQVGDMYIELFVETPRNLSGRQKELLKEFSEECSGANNPEHESFLGKVKRFFDSSASSV